MKYPCATCSFRKKYDKNPKAFTSKLWRLHINICPGFYGYYRSLNNAEKFDLKNKYHLKRK
ncbi:MAG: hypothetical protein WC140_06450 [Bacteroidales bacterium]